MTTGRAATFVLVPGAMHGRWAWDRIVPRLEALGHRAVAEDLPGTGDHAGDPPAEDVTLDLWADGVAALVRAAEPPVILVGHSRGGIVISAAADRVADRLAGLVYIAAVLGPPGVSGMVASGQSETGPTNGPIGADGAPIPADVAATILYDRCTDEDAAWAAARLRPEPMAPLFVPNPARWDGWGRLRRAYVVCTRDRLLLPSRQRAMLAAVPCDPVVRLASDHSPFLSVPDRLTEVLDGIAATFAPA